MEFHTLNRLADVQDNLGSVLDALGIKARIRSRLGSTLIIFENDDRTVRCPIEIKLGAQAMSGQLASVWGDSSLTIYEYENIPFGDNGWSYDRFLLKTHSLSFDDDQDKTFQTISNMIDEYGVVLSEHHPKSTGNENFVNAFLPIEDALHDAGQPLIECERIDGIESYLFDHEASGRWKVAFEEDAAVVYLNENPLRRIAATDHQAIGDFIREGMAGLGLSQMARDKAPKSRK